jgi:hypothetical protein
MKIGTLNCRGGGNKCSLIIDTIKRAGLEIFFLQETHVISNEDKKKVEETCDGMLLTNNGETNCRGVATFLKNKKEWTYTGVLKKI